jgi:Tfp pilus assembly pilus retraction ATPase PilT
MAALMQEINLKHAKHIITIESPVEYHFKIQRSFIRQREVGRDTPSFSQGLIDAMREDPDVLMVGEMREPDCYASDLECRRNRTSGIYNRAFRFSHRSTATHCSFLFI